MLLGPEAAGFSSTMITRLLRIGREAYQVWCRRSLRGKEHAYLWADGSYFNVRLEEDRTIDVRHQCNVDPQHWSLALGRLMKPSVSAAAKTAISERYNTARSPD